MRLDDPTVSSWMRCVKRKVFWNLKRIWLAGVRVCVFVMEKGGQEQSCLVNLRVLWVLSPHRRYYFLILFFLICLLHCVVCDVILGCVGELDVNKADGKEMDCHRSVSRGHMMSMCMCACDGLICILHRKNTQTKASLHRSRLPPD